jgi:aquaporin Z
VAATIPAPTAVEAPHSLSSRLIAEAVGTFFLVIAVIGTALFSSPSFGLLAVAFAIGLVVLVGAYAFGPVSGGHFNPAVTLGAAAAGRLAWRDVLPYIAAQIVGGAVGSSLIALIASTKPGQLATFHATGFASNGFGAHSPDHYGIWGAIIVEVVLTALFLYVILGVTHLRAAAGFAPIAIGFTLTVIHLIAIPVDNASVNPARSIATAIWGGPGALGQLWLFIVFPIVGALIAGFTFRFLFDRKPSGSYLEPFDLAGDTPAS